MQDSSHTLTIVDGEFTTWEGAHPDWDAPGQFREVIQVAALRFNWDTPWEEAETFCEFIRPKLNPTLSDYCKNLTGIKQECVVNASSAQTVFADLQSFIGDNKPAYSYGNDIRAFAETAGLQNFTNPLQPHLWGSIRDSLRGALIRELGYTPRWSRYPSGKMYELLDLHVEGLAHDPLHDVRSLAATLQELSKHRHEQLIPSLPQRAA